MSGLFCLGGVFLVVSVTMMVVGTSQAGFRGLLRRIRVTGCGELMAASRLPSYAAVFGDLGPGAEGWLRSPLSDQPCVWYELRVYHMGYAGENEWWEKTILHDLRTGPVAVTDASGTVYVDLALCQKRLHDDDGGESVVVDTVFEETQYSPRTGCEPGSALAELERRGLIGPHLLSTSNMPTTTTVRERVLRPGRRILAVGNPVRHPSGAVVLGLGNIGVRGVSTRSLPEILASLRGNSRSNFTAFRELLLVSLAMLAVGYVLLWWTRHH